MKDVSSIPRLGRSPGRELGNPLQHSCLENPRDVGDWWVTVLGVTKSQTRLKWHNMHTWSISKSCWSYILDWLPPEAKAGIRMWEEWLILWKVIQRRHPSGAREARGEKEGSECREWWALFWWKSLPEALLSCDATDLFGTTQGNSLSCLEPSRGLPWCPIHFLCPSGLASFSTISFWTLCLTDTLAFL